MSDGKPKEKRKRRRRDKGGKKQSMIEKLCIAQKDAASWKEDGQKFVWGMTKEGKYEISLIKEEDEDVLELVTVNTGAHIKTTKNKVFPVNPPHMERSVDMASLSYLNPPGVLHNLKQRYFKDDIYTYSGLFLVVVNPYKGLPIYGQKIIQKYRGRGRNDVPPHVFVTADTAYRNMLKNSRDQSILVTGESGAGKTVNAKIIIQYLTSIAGADGGGGKLSEQIKSTNPLLEAFGNAKTERNNNSSRFGKFIKINFDPSGYIVGTQIVNYLLEITRVVTQSSTDRNYHIFYQILSSKKYRTKYKLQKVDEYNYVNTNIHVEGMDDAEELRLTQESMKTIGFNSAESEFCLSVPAALLHLGNIEITEDKGSLSEINDKTSLKHAAKILGVTSKKLEKSLLRPDLKTPGKIIQTHVSVSEAIFNRDALVKSIYKRLFDWIVIRINKSLKTQKKVKSFIGILDIAGFEIFELNSFEQLCINYTNEKLQQFFNEHMFQKEQDEYEREQIEWTREDYGDDLQPTIDLIEHRNMIMDLLDEQVFRGNASKDKDLVRFFSSSRDVTASKSFSTDRFDPMQFNIVHYAGEVSYNVNHWLTKNKDPVNRECLQVMAGSKISLVSNLFNDAKKPQQEGGRKGRFQTISILYRKQLAKLMGDLGHTEPHFVRCIKPNELKKPGIINDSSVLNQLNCNGVLEGIRISRKGYPGRKIYEEFVSRYKILARKSDLDSKTSFRAKAEHIVKEKCGLIVGKEYRLGLTKIFFKAGQEAKIEKFREKEVARIIVTIQAAARGRLGIIAHEKLVGQVAGIKLIQNNIRAYNLIKDWTWWNLFSRARPLVEDYKLEEQLNQMTSAIQKLKEDITGEGTKREDLAKEKSNLNKNLIKLDTQINIAEKNKAEFEKGLDDAKEIEREKIDDIEQLKIDKIELDRQKSEHLSAIATRSETLKKKTNELGNARDTIKTTNREIGKVRLDIKSGTTEKVRLEANADRLEDELEELKKRLETQDGLVSELTLEKKRLDDELKEYQFRLSGAQSSMKKVEQQKAQTEQDLNEVERELKKLNNANSLLTSSDSKLTRQIELLTNQANDYKEQLQALTRSNRTLENTNKDLSDKLEDLEQRKMHIEKELRGNQGDAKDLNADIERIKEDIEGLQDEEKDLKEDVTKLKKDTTDTEDVKFNLKKENDDLGKKIDELEYTHKEKSETTQNEIDELKRKISDLESSLGEQLLQASNQKSTLQKKYDGETDNHKGLNKDYNVLVGELEDLRNQWKRLESSFKSEQAKLLSEKQNLSSLEDQRRELKSKLDDLETTLQTAREENTRTDQQRKALNSQLVEDDDTLDTKEKERDDLEDDRNEQQKMLAKLKLELGENTSNADSLKSKLSSLIQDSKTANSSLNELNLNASSLKQKKKDLQEKLNETNTHIETEKGKILGLNKKLSRADDEKDKFKKELDHWEGKLRDEYEAKQICENDLREKKAELESQAITEKELRNKNDSLERKVNETTEEVNEKTGKIQKYKTEISLLKSKIQLATDGNDDLEVKIKGLEEDEKSLKSNLEKVEAKAQSEKQQKVQLATENGKLRSQLDAQKDLLAQNENKFKALFDSLKRKFEVDEQDFDSDAKVLTDEIEKLKKENKTLHKQNQSNKQLGKGITEEAIKKLENEYQKRIEKLRNEVASERKSKITAEASTRNYDFQLNEVKELHEQEEKKRKKAEIERKALVLEIDELRDLADEGEILQEELEELKQEAETYEKQLSKEVSREKNEKQKAEIQIDKLKSQLEDIKKKLNEMRVSSSDGTKKIRSKYEKQIIEMEDLIQKAKKEKKEAVRHAKKLEKNLRSLKRKLKSADSEKQNAIEKTDSIRKELSRLREQTSEDGRLASRADTQNKVLTKEINQLRKKQRELEDEIDKIREEALDGKKKGFDDDDDSDSDLSGLSDLSDDGDDDLSE